MIDKLSKGRTLFWWTSLFFAFFLIFSKKNTNFAPETLNT